MMKRIRVFFSLLFASLSAADLSDLTWTVTDGEVTIVDCDEIAEGTLEIPARIEGFPVTAIEDKAFSGCGKLINITIPGGVSSIGKSAFSHCWKLGEVTLPAGLTEIEEDAFYNSGLRRVVIPGGVLAIGRSAFSFCLDLSEVHFPESLTVIDSYAFEYCFSLSHITIPDSVTRIGYSAFYIDDSDLASDHDPGLSSISLGSGLKYIEELAFRGQFRDTQTAITITIPASTIHIGLDAISMAFFTDEPGNVFFDGPAPEIPFVPDHEIYEHSPIAPRIHVWPQHLESFGEEHPLWSLSRIIVRDTTPTISSLSLETETVTISITGAPDTAYICKTSDDLAEFQVIETDPEILMLDSSGKMDFSVQSSEAGRFFVIEESP